MLRVNVLPVLGYGMKSKLVAAGKNRAKEWIMWDDEADIFEVLDEHDLECESDDDFSDLELDSDTAEDAEEEDFDEED